jgi:hypothetical protein
MIGPLWAILGHEWPKDSDFIIYAIQLKTFSSQLWAGDWYPRWLSYANAGLGAPHLFVFGPLPYYVGSLFQWLAPLDGNGFGRVAIGMGIALFIAGITSYRWLRLQLTTADAERGALLYAGFPYLLVIIYFAFGFPQIWAMAIFPFLLEASHELLQKSWVAVPKLALAFAALFLTHLPSVVIFSAVPCLYIVVFAAPRQRLSCLGLVMLSVTLAAGLTAIYWMPLVQNHAFIRLQSFTSGRFFYANNFSNIYAFVGFLLVIVPLAFLGYFLCRENGACVLDKPVRFWLTILTGYVFMVLPLSRPLWALLPPLQNLQFPFRFYTGMVPGAVYVATRWLSHLKEKSLYKILFVPVLLCVSVVSSQRLFTHTEDPAVTPVLTYNLTPFIAGQMQTIWAQHENYPREDFMYELPGKYSSMPVAELSQGEGSVTGNIQSPRRINLHADITSAKASIAIRQFYFPGWQVVPESIKIEPDKEGLLSFVLTHGKHDITLQATWKGEREGLLISVLSLLLIVVIAVKSNRQTVLI